MSMRTQRVGVVIQEEIARMLLTGIIKDPRLTGAIASVTGVKVSRDLQQALVFVSVMAGDGPAMMAALNHAAGFIRGQLGPILRMRFVPNLQFRLDTSLEQGERITRLLHELNVPPAEEGDEIHGSKPET